MNATLVKPALITIGIGIAICIASIIQMVQADGFAGFVGLFGLVIGFGVVLLGGLIAVAALIQKMLLKNSQPATSRRVIVPNQNDSILSKLSTSPQLASLYLLCLVLLICGAIGYAFGLYDGSGMQGLTNSAIDIASFLALGLILLIGGYGATNEEKDIHRLLPFALFLTVVTYLAFFSVFKIS